MIIVEAKANARWSLDFVSDQLSTCRRLRVLNIVDLSEICVLLKEIALDNGPEGTSKAMFDWSERTGVALRFIEPGRPVQNAFVECFNGRFRHECLNQNWFRSLRHAREEIEAWRIHYNTERPHSSLGYQSPTEFLQKTRAVTLELWAGSASPPAFSEVSSLQRPQRRGTVRGTSAAPSTARARPTPLKGTLPLAQVNFSL